MKVHIYSYRYAAEILQHKKNLAAWKEIEGVLKKAPLFIYPGKSARNKGLDVVQQVMNTYFDRRFSVDLGWVYHPLATRIKDSGLAADFRKEFADITVQAEIQFGNMSRWYSDVFKFQTAYSQSLINLGICVVPTAKLAKRIDSNVVNFERTRRELPSAELSITLPIILAGVEPDKKTPIVDISECGFSSVKAITGKGKTLNRWRIVNAYLSGVPMAKVNESSPTGKLPADPSKLDATEADEEE